MSLRLLLFAAMLTSDSMIPVRAGEVSPSPGGLIVLRHCEIDYKRSSLIGVAHMGTTSTTILQDCFVRPGDRVSAKQVLGRVMDVDIRADLEFRTAEAANDNDFRVKEARLAQALNRLKRSADLQKRTFLSAEEYSGYELDAVTARLEIEQSKYRRQLAEIELRRAQTMLHAREYVSPHDGVVVEVLKEQGEAISMVEPIFRVVDVDVLKVSGYLNLNDYWRVRKGLEVRITPEIDGDDLPIEREVFTGRLVFVDRRIDPTTRTCKVVAEVANRDLLLASGLEARMEIILLPPATGPREQGAKPPSLVPSVLQTEKTSRDGVVKDDPGPSEPKNVQTP